jgi:serine/threonine protein kinase
MDTPRSIGRYQIKRWLTSGAMGDIYEAHDPVIERRVAIKVLRRELIERGDAGGWLERFRQEARAAGRLLHSNIVTLLDYGEQDGAPFLAMEYVEGESLDVRLKRSSHLPYRDAIAIITQTLSGLDFAHANGVIHRDIKPSNILLTKTGLTKITDFGIAHIEASDLTTEGDVLGTPSYMAPEQLVGREVDHRTDQFAAGAVLFELLSGVKPFHGKSLAESMLNMESRGPTDICALNPEVTPALKGVIETALAFDPERRYPSVAEFSRALVEAGAMPGRDAPNDRSSDETVLASASPTPSLRSAASWPTDPLLGTETLAEIERDLATYIGPMARIAVRRSAKTIGNVPALYQILASYIEDERNRTSFISKGQRWAQTHASLSTAGQSGSWQGKPISIAPDVLSRIEAALTQYIGPIARVVLRQQLSKSASLADLYHDLAAYIPNERDRDKFLNSRRGA